MVESFRIYSCYISTSTILGEFKEISNEIMESVRTIGAKAIIEEDFNAKSKTWASLRTHWRML